MEWSDKKGDDQYYCCAVLVKVSRTKQQGSLSFAIYLFVGRSDVQNGTVSPAFCLPRLPDTINISNSRLFPSSFVSSVRSSCKYTYSDAPNNSQSQHTRVPGIKSDRRQHTAFPLLARRSPQRLSRRQHKRSERKNEKETGGVKNHRTHLDQQHPLFRPCILRWHSTSEDEQSGC